MTKQLQVDPKTEILIKAREILKHGWCQGAGQKISRTTGSLQLKHCITGAIWNAVGGFNTSDILQVELLRATVEGIYPVIGKVLPHYTRPSDIVDWNDYPTRTQEEVLELIDQAIAVSMNGGINARSEEAKAV